MGKSDSISSIVLIVISLFIILYCIPNYCDSGYDSMMSPSLLPYILSIFIFILSIIMLMKSLFSKKDNYKKITIYL